MELRDDRVVLRPWRMDDAPAVESACRDPEIPRWIPWVPKPYSRGDAEAYLRECLESGDERYPFAVVDSETGELLGAIDMGLNSQRYPGARRLLGGRGSSRTGSLHARSAAPLAVGPRRSAAATARADHRSEKVASQRVAEKVGYRKEGVLRAHLRHPDGRIRDSVMFALLPGGLVEE